MSILGAMKWWSSTWSDFAPRRNLAGRICGEGLLPLLGGGLVQPKSHSADSPLQKKNDLAPTVLRLRNPALKPLSLSFWAFPFFACCVIARDQGS